MKKMKRILAFALVCIMIVGAVQPAAAATTSIRLSSKTATISVGKTKTLTLKKGTKVIKTGVKWKTSSKTIATVSTSGKITAKKAGTATISATYKNKKYNCKVTVKDVIKLSKTSATLKAKETTSIILRKNGVKVTTGVKWSSSNKAVATISTAGKITAKQGGTATITATYKLKKYSCKVTVTDVIKISNTSVKILEGKEYTLKIIKNGTAVTSGITWSSSNNAVAIVSSTGKITGKKAGTATITATYKTKKYTCKVTVSAVPWSAATDMSVVYGVKSTPIEFTLTTNNYTAAEIAEIKKEYENRPGFTVEGNTVKGITDCITATYTFKRLPKTLDEIKAIPLTKNVKTIGNQTVDVGMFNPLAASICSIAAIDQSKLGNAPLYKDNHPVWDYLEYLNGNVQYTAINNFTKDTFYDVFSRNLKDNRKYAFFDGATPTNNYTPNKPYTFTLVESPYILPATTNMVNQQVPERHMIYMYTAAADSGGKYMDAWYSNSDQNWYTWGNQYGVFSGLRDPQNNSGL